jgi:hypothetical protein
LGEWRYSSTHSLTSAVGRWVVSFIHRQLNPSGKEPWYPMDRRLGGLQSRSGRGGEEESSKPLPGLQTSTIQPVAQRYATELSRLLSYLFYQAIRNRRPTVTNDSWSGCTKFESPWLSWSFLVPPDKSKFLLCCFK